MPTFPRVHLRPVRGYDHVLLNAAGNPWCRQVWTAAFCRTLAGAGLGDRQLAAHGLRHGFATKFLAMGGNPRDLQRNLGHRQLSTTMVYADTVDRRRHEATQAVSYGLSARAPAAKRALRSSGA